MPANPNPNRSDSVAASSAQMLGALVERARVVSVNIRNYTVNVNTELSFKPKFDIPFMSPYCHQAQGEGIYVMPEVGSVCWICTPSEKDRDAFVLGWTMVDEGGAYRGGRPLLNPGDVHASTRDGNFLTLRRGGIVQIGSTPACQRVFLPIRNVIRDYAENYGLHTPAGDLTWEVARKEEDGDGHQTCTFTLAAREFADDPADKTVGLLKIGSHGDDNNTILSLLTRDRGGGTKQTCLEINKNGDMEWTVKSLKLTVKGDMAALVGGNLEVEVDGDISATGAAALNAEAQSIALTAGPASLGLSGSIASLDGAQVRLGSAEFNIMRASPDMLAWMGQVTAFTGATPPTIHISPKVKA